MFEDLVKLVDLLFVDSKVDVIELVLYLITLFENRLNILQVVPLLLVPVILNHHLLVLKSMSNISVLVPIVQHLQTLYE